MFKGLYIGIMSGTSMDGIDIALCKIDENSCSCIAYEEYELSTYLKAHSLSMITKGTTLAEIGALDVALALEYADAVNHFLNKYALKSCDIVAIGSHGQTLWHQPLGDIPFSMQLGNPSLLASKTAIDVVTDFRQKDIANGGQGAPFAPAFHQFLFSDIPSCAVVNIGGMANITVLESPLIGYDTGCGNVLLDMWMYEHNQAHYDKDGVWAKSGTVEDALLTQLLGDDYFALPYPKSTGREYFNRSFLMQYLALFESIKSEDVQATLLALTVQSIANEVKKFNITTLLVCGGGVKNRFMMEQLQQGLPHVKVQSTEVYGVSPDAMEAMIFAWFAYKRLRREAIELTSVTGTKKNSILGGVYAGN